MDHDSEPVDTEPEAEALKAEITDADRERAEQVDERAAYRGRAMLIKLVAQALADQREQLTGSGTAPEGEVLEADDTVPVERLAHWLHGEFDTSAENSELLPWAQEREGVKARYRHTARALMSQLPELFR